MRINLDCVRDILFEIEKFAQYGDFYEYLPENLPEGSFLSKYDPDTVLYHVRQCDLSGYLFNTNWKVFEYVAIEDLTPSGHAFISNIRSEDNWSKTKSVVSKIGGASLKIVSSAAEGITNALLDRYIREMGGHL